MKEIRLSSLNKMAWMLSKGIFTDSDFTLDGDKLVLVAEVGEDYLTLVEEYKVFEEKNREFLQAFKELKLIKKELLEKRQEEEQERSDI